MGSAYRARQRTVIGSTGHGPDLYMLGQKFRVGREDNWDVLAEPGQRRALRTLGGPLFSKTPSDTQVDERLCVVSPGPQNRSEKCVRRKDSLTPHPRNRAPTRYTAYR